MFEDGLKIGVCLISGKELLIYIVSYAGEHIEYNVIKKVDIVLPNKHNKGGSSSGRFGRIVQIVRNNYVDVIVDHIIKAYMIDNNTKCLVPNIILAGPGPMKTDVSNTDEFKQYFTKYLHKIIPTDSVSDNTIYEIVPKIIDEITHKNIMSVDEEINALVQTNYDNLSFGYVECIELIKENNIKKIFINEKVLDSELRDVLLNKFSNESVLTDSHVLKTYGDWIAVRKW